MVTLPKIALVGAGVAGITCATRLSQAGFPVQLFDKSRGLGGRLATRRWPSGLAFDHGAASFSADDVAFTDALTQARDTVQRWQPRTTGDSAETWVGAPRMNAWLKAQLGDQSTQLNTHIADITSTEDGWSLGIEKRKARADAGIVILATPAVQAAALATPAPELVAQLEQISIAPCWALMIALKDHAQTPQDVYAEFAAENPLAWLGRNAGKPGRDVDNTGWVAHASAAWSTENLELSTEAAASALLPAVLDTLGISRDAVAKTQAHRWRYANVTTPAGKAYLHNDAKTLFAIGDGCLGGGVEGAFKSGAALADALIDAHN